MKWECPLDITAHYLKYPPTFVAYLKSRGYFGFLDDGHKRLWGRLWKAKP